MLRKLLLIALCVLLGYGIYNSVMQGYTFQNFEIKSYATLVDENKNLDAKVSELKTENEVKFPSTERRLQSVKNEYKSKKEAYEELTATASKEDIAEANKKEQYMLDF